MPKAIVFCITTILAACAATIAEAQVTSQSDDAVPANPEPRWFKGNLHTHSLWSDGNDYPEMIVDWYRRQNYQFLALSDHNILSQGPNWTSVAEANKRAGRDSFALYRKRFGDTWVETRTEKGDLQVRLKPLGEYRHLVESAGRFLLIQGEEITDKFESKPIHMNATNVHELINPQGGNSVVEVMTNDLDAVEKQSVKLGRPILAHLNHPNFGYGITAEELAMVTKERFFEVYNGHPDVHHKGDESHASVERMWDIINTLRLGEMKVAPVNGLATDDSHNYFGKTGSSPGRGWIMVNARHLTPESILKAIEAGHFYASSGVSLQRVQFTQQSKTLTLAIEPQSGASYTTQFIGTLKNYDHTRKPVIGKDGQPLPVTQRYSNDVGKVLATVEGTNPRYNLTGDELYVRAVVTSSSPPENPSFPNQKAQAWTQPIGWQKWVEETANPNTAPAAEDFTSVEAASLGVKLVSAKEDPKTHFIVGGKNATDLVAKLTEINGRKIADLEKDMRPGAVSVVGSEKGFLGDDERLVDVLVADNKFVVDESKLTHQELAKHLLLLAAIGAKTPNQEFLYHGQRFRLKTIYSRGEQLSPFNDGTKTSAVAVLRNLSNGKELQYSLLVPEMILRYGFYEGKGTPYRVDPKQILQTLAFLERKK